MMATTHQHVGREIQASEATAAKRTIYFVVGTHEAQTVTVSKAGGSFGASSSAAAQVDGNLYKLVIDAGDLDTEGELAFKCAGSTDTQYLYGFLVVDHDPFDAIAEILADTGMDGVKIGADAITAAAIADDAISAEHLADDAITAAAIATDAIGSDAIAATAAAEIADQVLEEAIADHKSTAGSLAQMVNLIRAVAAGKKVVDNGDQTIEHVDTDGATTLVTLTRSEAGDEITWTPS